LKSLHLFLFFVFFFFLNIAAAVGDETNESWERLLQFKWINAVSPTVTGLRFWLPRVATLIFAREQLVCFMEMAKGCYS